jgi:hypothetical protein
MLNDPNFNEQELTHYEWVFDIQRQEHFWKSKTNCKLFQLVALNERMDIIDQVYLK